MGALQAPLWATVLSYLKRSASLSFAADTLNSTQEQKAKDPDNKAVACSASCTLSDADVATACGFSRVDAFPTAYFDFTARSGMRGRQTPTC